MGGCRLVEFASPEEAIKAVAELHDSELDGRKIFVREVRWPSHACRCSIGGKRKAHPCCPRRCANTQTHLLTIVRQDREEKPIGGGNRIGPRRRNNPSMPTKSKGVNGESIAGRQVFVGNLPWSATSQDLTDNFGTCGAPWMSSICSNRAWLSECWRCQASLWTLMWFAGRCGASRI